MISNSLIDRSAALHHPQPPHLRLHLDLVSLYSDSSNQSSPVSFMLCAGNLPTDMRHCTPSLGDCGPMEKLPYHDDCDSCLAAPETYYGVGAWSTMICDGLERPMRTAGSRGVLRELIGWSWAMQLPASQKQAAAKMAVALPWLAIFGN